MLWKQTTRVLDRMHTCVSLLGSTSMMDSIINKANSSLSLKMKPAGIDTRRGYPSIDQFQGVSLIHQSPSVKEVFTRDNTKTFKYHKYTQHQFLFFSSRKSIMGDIAEQERIERRRARRQQRILASAESRLSKITGSQAGTVLWHLAHFDKLLIRH